MTTRRGRKPVQTATAELDTPPTRESIDYAKNLISKGYELPESANPRMGKAYSAALSEINAEGTDDAFVEQQKKIDEFFSEPIPLNAELRLRAVAQAKSLIPRGWTPDTADPEQVEAYTAAIAELRADAVQAETVVDTIGSLKEGAEAALAALPALEAAVALIGPAYAAAKLNPQAVDESAGILLDEVLLRFRAILRVFK